MAPRLYATVGRAADNDVVLDHATVSNHHARLSWSGASLLVEDLSSANGTFVDGQRVKAVRTRPGVELRVGEVALPWSHDGLRNLLKAGIGARTLVMPATTPGAGSFVCGACGRTSPTPPGPTPNKLTCPGCGATLRARSKARGGNQWSAVSVITAISTASAVLVYWLVAGSQGLPWQIPTSPTQIKQTLNSLQADEHIGGDAAKIAKAFTPMEAVTRDAAIKLAARTEGPFHVEQVAEIWNAVRQAWRYVNDPQGQEYFATATETIQNGYIGDCDDFATTLASMVMAIGGKARVIMMDGPRGGHAYAEACVDGDPAKVATELNKYYRSRWRHYLTGPVPSKMAYRVTDDCPIWLNLDWNSIVPGGAYEPEYWSVAVYQDGHSETLAPANPAPRPSDATGKTKAP